MPISSTKPITKLLKFRKLARTYLVALSIAVQQGSHILLIIICNYKFDRSSYKEEACVGRGTKWWRSQYILLLSYIICEDRLDFFET